MDSLSVCVCVLYCVHMGLQMHPYELMHGEARAGHWMSSFITLCFTVSTEPEAHHFYLDWLASEFSGSACLDPLMPT